MDITDYQDSRLYKLNFAFVYEKDTYAEGELFLFCNRSTASRTLGVNKAVFVSLADRAMIGLAVARKLGSSMRKPMFVEYRPAQTKGGQATKAKHGTEHYKEMGRKSAEARAAKKVASP